MAVRVQANDSGGVEVLRHGAITYTCGDTYHGETLNGRRHGESRAAETI
jgi:hypothetical protein